MLKQSLNMKKVKVFSPATVANVACGFDAMGFAFEGAGDEIEMELLKEQVIRYVNLSGVKLPEDIEMNIMTPTLRAIMAAYDYKGGVEVTILKKILPGSGIGSSAAAVASAAYGFNALMGGRYSEMELIEFALEGECMASGSRHADNVAPALMGNFVLVRDYNPTDVVSIKRVNNLFCAIVHPHIEVKTIDSRAVLKKELDLSVAIRQWANLGAMVAALTMGDNELLSRSMKDYVAEPYRKKFIPGYDTLKANILEAGALGANISGSGPAMFALCDSLETAKKITHVMKNHFVALNIDADTYASPISNKGTYIKD